MDPATAFDSWDEHVEWMVERYEDGWSTVQIADKLDGISHSQVNNRLRDAGVEIRDPTDYELPPESIPGPDNPMYRNGSSWRVKPKWRKTRKKAIRRDGHTCQECERKPDELHVHHIEPVSEGGAKFKLSNLVTLCAECHIAVHS